MGTVPNWIFGYGSLIWRPDFPHIERCRATLPGFTRRFWQGSHDHRGTPEAPGRVVTLMPEAGARCVGMAFAVAAKNAERVFADLDFREKNGYRRRLYPVELDDGRRVAAVTYIGDPEHPAFLGEAPAGDIARQIHQATGPSGANRDYLVALARALQALDARDEHVFELLCEVMNLGGGPGLEPEFQR